MAVSTIRLFFALNILVFSVFQTEFTQASWKNRECKEQLQLISPSQNESGGRSDRILKADAPYIPEGGFDLSKAGFNRKGAARPAEDTNSSQQAQTSPPAQNPAPSQQSQQGTGPQGSGHSSGRAAQAQIRVIQGAVTLAPTNRRLYRRPIPITAKLDSVLEVTPDGENVIYSVDTKSGVDPFEITVVEIKSWQTMLQFRMDDAVQQTIIDGKNEIIYFISKTGSAYGIEKVGGVWQVRNTVKLWRNGVFLTNDGLHLVEQGDPLASTRFYIYDVHSTRLIRAADKQLNVNGGILTSAEFKPTVSANGKYLLRLFSSQKVNALRNALNVVVIESVSTGNRLNVTPIEVGVQRAQKMATDKDNKRLFVAGVSDDYALPMSIKVFEWGTWVELQNIPLTLKGNILDVAVVKPSGSSNGQEFLIVSAEHGVEVFDTQSWNTVARVNFAQNITRAELSVTEDHYVIRGGDTYVLDTRSWQVLQVLNRYYANDGEVAINSAGDFLLAHGLGKHSVVGVDLNAGLPVVQFIPGQTAHHLMFFGSAFPGVSTAVLNSQFRMTPDGKFLFLKSSAANRLEFFEIKP